MPFFLLTLPTDTASEKFAQIYRLYHRGLYAMALSILKDQALAEDALQNAMIRIYKNLDKISEIDCSKTRSFVIIITRREAFRLYDRRRDDNLVELTDLHGSGGDGVWAQTERNYTRAELFAALSLLPERDRFLLVGKHIYGYSYQELAELLDMPPKTVSVYLSRVRQKLLKSLTEKEAAQDA